LIIAIPDGTAVDIAGEVERIKQAWDASHARPEKLRAIPSIVTREALERALDERPTIVHFVGQERRDDDSSSTIRLNRPEGGSDWVPAEQFARFFHNRGVRLVVLTSVRDDGTNASSDLTTVGRLLLQEGVPALVAFRQPLDHSLATRFCDRFYRSLFAGDTAGEIHRAVEDACDDLFRHSSDGKWGAFVSPVLFVEGRSYALFDRSARIPPRRPAWIIAVVASVLGVAAVIGFAVLFKLIPSDANDAEASRDASATGPEAAPAVIPSSPSPGSELEQHTGNDPPPEPTETATMPPKPKADPPRREISPAATIPVVIDAGTQGSDVPVDPCDAKCRAYNSCAGRVPLTAPQREQTIAANCKLLAGSCPCGG
jgi:hypothetical protein